MAKQHLTEGAEIRIFERGEEIDRAIIRRVGTSGDPATDEIQTESLKLFPGEKTEFVFFPHRDSDKEGWRMLFKDPMTGSRCFSQRAPAITFELL